MVRFLTQVGGADSYLNDYFFELDNPGGGGMGITILFFAAVVCYLVYRWGKNEWAKDEATQSINTFRDRVYGVLAAFKEMKHEK